MMSRKAYYGGIWQKCAQYMILLGAYLLLASCAATDVQGNQAAAVSIAVQQASVPMKKIALSFDDSPRHQGAFMTPTKRRKLILSSLRDAKVNQAVFFINPGQINDANQDHIIAYANAGHVLANHTNDHIGLSDVSADEFLANVDSAQMWFKTQPLIKSSVRPWMRFPYLDEGGKDRQKRDAVREGLRQRGLNNGYVTADASDWYIDDLASKAKRADKNIDQKMLRNLFVDSHLLSANFAYELSRKIMDRAPVQVMLLHEADVTALYLNDLIKALRFDGWHIVSADEAYADPLADLPPTMGFAGGTILGMLADDMKITPQWYEDNNEKIIEALFNKRVLNEEK